MPPPLSSGPAEAPRCIQHPNVVASAKCSRCGAFVCDTCKFDVPGGALCPTCAVSPLAVMTPARKKKVIISFVLAVWCTAVLVALRLGVFRPILVDPDSKQLLGTLLLLILVAPSAAGLAVGMSGMERRVPNGPAIWVPVIWNGIVLTGFLLLCVVGLLKKV